MLYACPYYMKKQEEILQKAALKYEFDRLFDKERIIINNRKTYRKKINVIIVKESYRKEI